MSSALRRPATRDPHTNYFIVLQDMLLQQDSPQPPPLTPPFPPYLDWVARTKGTGTVTSMMTGTDFNNATAGFATYSFIIPDTPTPTTRKRLLAGDILKDLGSVVYTYDQLGSPNPRRICTYRLVQLVAGGDSTGSDPHNPDGSITEGPYGNAANQYNTFWIKTWTMSPYWYRTAAIARLG